MSDIKNNDEQLQEMKREMGDELGSVFHKIHRELTNLFFFYNHYDVLYQEDNIDVMNKTAPRHFYLVQKIITDYFFIILSRMTDRATTAGKNNISISLLPDMVDDEIKDDVESRVKKIVGEKGKDGLVKNIRENRNKKISHIDYGTYIDGSDMPEDVTFGEIRIVLYELQDLLNIIYGHYLKAEHATKEAKFPERDFVIRLLEYGKKYQELKRDLEFNPSKTISLDDLK